MNINSINEVIELQNELSIATNRHKALMGLTTPKGGRFGLNSRAYIKLGGDEYGNHSLHKMEVQIVNSPEMMAACRKLQSDAWGKVVGLRLELRNLGVTLEEADELAKAEG